MPTLAALVRAFRALLRWECLAVLAWVGLLGGVTARVLLRPGQQTVYPIFAQAGRDWLAGADVYRLGPGAEGDGGQKPASVWDLVRPPGRAPVGWGLELYRYSPLVAGLLVPLGLLPDRLGEVLWRLGNAAAVIAAALWWLRRAPPYPLSRAERGLFLAALVPFSLASINNGQTNPLLLALLLATFTAAADRRYTLASLFLALAFWLKLYPLALGLLLAVAYPRRFGWRLPLAVALLGAAAFLLQRPGYVAAEYLTWARALGLDDRSDWPTELAYRDLRLLCRAWGLSLSDTAHAALRLASAGSLAALVLAGRRWPRRRRLCSLMNLGLCWVLLFGPATEAATYQLLGPVMAWAMLDGWRRRGPVVRAMVLASAGVYWLGLAANLFPFAARVHAFGPHPLSALLLFGLLLGLDVRDLLRPALGDTAVSRPPLST